MIDPEFEVFDRISEELYRQFPNINITSEYVPTPASFPHVSIEMTDNPVYRTFSGSFDNEQATIPTFTVNVYSDKTEGRKLECKRIMDVIDKMLYDMNFNRRSMRPVPNMEDVSIYRLVGVYIVVTDGKYFYRR